MTWNRPGLLGQSLPQIEREARKISAPLVISDDRSDDPTTLRLVADAEARGIEVIRRDFIRRRNRQFGEQAWKRAHSYHQLNSLFAFRHVLDNYPSAEFVLKVDDDVVLAEGAFAIMLDAWEKAARDGHDVLALSGLATIHESIVERFDGYVITVGLCGAAILYRRREWEQFVASVPQQHIVGYGFDVAFRDLYAAEHRTGARQISVTPSVVYHTGIHGVHMGPGQDINVDYVGSLDNVIVG